MGKNGENNPQVDGWGPIVTGWKKSIGLLGITYFVRIDTALCLMS